MYILTRDPVVTTFRRRMFVDDLDVLCPVVGKRGSTKSGCTTTMGYLLDRSKKNPGKSRFILPSKLIPKSFTLKPGEILPRTIYKPSDFMAILNQKPRPPIGTCIVWDETGVEGDSRDFMKKKNKLLKRTFETIRSFNYAIFLTAPTLKSFDISYSRVSTFLIKTLGKARFPEGYFGRTRVFELNADPITGKLFNKNLHYREDGLLKKLERPYYISKPPAFMEEPYKRYKLLFQTKLYRDYEYDFEDIESLEFSKKTVEEEDSFEGVLSQIKKNPLDYYDKTKSKFVVAAVQYRGGTKISELMARKIIQLLEFDIQKGSLNIS